MTTNDRGALKAALYAVLSALARICVRNGFPFEAFTELAKHAFVDVAKREFTIAGRKQSASRVSLLTGLHRKEVGRMLTSEQPHEVAADKIAYSAAVIAGWRRDKRFLDKRGNPAALPFDDAAASFAELVRRYGGGDVPPRAVLDELVRVGAVATRRDGRIKLAATAYVPAMTSAEGMSFLGSDVSDLIRTIDHNLSETTGRGYFQRKVAYDNLPQEALDEILDRVERDGQSVLEKLDRVMARRDRDANPKAGGSGRHRAMVGIYCFVEPFSQQPPAPPGRSSEDAHERQQGDQRDDPED
jgi:hypothetical protein